MIAEVWQEAETSKRDSKKVQTEFNETSKGDYNNRGLPEVRGARSTPGCRARGKRITSRYGGSHGSYDPWSRDTANPW